MRKEELYLRRYCGDETHANEDNYWTKDNYVRQREQSVIDGARE